MRPTSCRTGRASTSCCCIGEWWRIWSWFYLLYLLDHSCRMSEDWALLPAVSAFFQSPAGALAYLQDVLDGLLRLLPVLAEWGAAEDGSGGPDGTASGTSTTASASSTTLNDLQTSCAVLALHLVAVLRAQTLAAPAACLQRAVQCLLAALRVPDAASLQRSRLLRDDGWTVVQALVEALPYRAGESSGVEPRPIFTSHVPPRSDFSGRASVVGRGGAEPAASIGCAAQAVAGADDRAATRAVSGGAGPIGRLGFPLTRHSWQVTAAVRLEATQLQQEPAVNSKPTGKAAVAPATAATTAAKLVRIG